METLFQLCLVKIIKILTVSALIFFNCTSVFAQAKEIIESRLDYIDSCIVRGVNSFYDKETVSFILFCQDVYRVRLSQDFKKSHTIDINEYEKFKKDYNANDKYIHIMDSCITAFFVPHSHTFEKLTFETIWEFDTEYEAGMYLHYMDRSLEQHVFDFKRLSDYHMERIKRGFNGNPVYQFVDNGDCLFVIIIGALSGLWHQNDPYRPTTLDMDVFVKLASWCEMNQTNSDIEIQFFDEFCDYWCQPHLKIRSSTSF